MAYDGEENFVGSFPNDFHYPEPGEATAIGGGTLDAQPSGTNSLQVCKPRILLMGLRRSGKSSIQKVRFLVSALNLLLFLFLDAFSHLYKRVCLSVRPSVRRSVPNELNF